MQRPSLSDTDFRRIRKFVETHIGIRLPDIKKVMVEGRLQKHLVQLKFTSFREYCDFILEDPRGKDYLQGFIDLITTNKTDFFREPDHFTFLAQNLLPQHDTSSGVRLWSAACSSGEEPYTLGMVMEEYIAEHGRFPYEIHASDISEKVLKAAKEGIYSMEKIEGISLGMKKKYFLKSRDTSEQRARVKRFLREKMRFFSINLLSDNYDAPRNFDFIFLRNVMIYFERPVQEKIVNKMYHHLKPGGCLFIGHSESLSGINTPFINIATTVYKKEIR